MSCDGCVGGVAQTTPPTCIAKLCLLGVCGLDVGDGLSGQLLRHGLGDDSLGCELFGDGFDDDGLSSELLGGLFIAGGLGLDGLERQLLGDSLGDDSLSNELFGDLFDGDGPLSLAVTRFDDVLDALVQSGS